MLVMRYLGAAREELVDDPVYFPRTGLQVEPDVDFQEPQEFEVRWPRPHRALGEELGAFLRGL